MKGLPKFRSEEQETLAMVREGRRAIQAGSKGIPVAHLFNKIRRRSLK